MNPNGLRPPSMVQIGSRPSQQPQPPLPAYVISATANGNANNRQVQYPRSRILDEKYHGPSRLDPLPQDERRQQGEQRVRRDKEDPQLRDDVE